jgi:hypothetical protein
MGTWDASSFGNDTSVDWSYGLEKANGLAYIEEALDRVLLTTDSSVDAEAGEQAIAAAEVLARLRGRFGVEDSYSETTDEWVRANPQVVPPELVAKAMIVLDRVTRAPSELYELWEESGDLEGWTQEVDGLRKRLS